MKLGKIKYGGINITDQIFCMGVMFVVLVVFMVAVVYSVHSKLGFFGFVCHK